MTIGGPLIGNGTGIFRSARTTAPVGFAALAPSKSNVMAKRKTGHLVFKSREIFLFYLFFKYL